MQEQYFKDYVPSFLMFFFNFTYYSMAAKSISLSELIYSKFSPASDPGEVLALVVENKSILQLPT